MPPAPPTDPRSIITPDAFSVSGELVGLPLASPSRRLSAMGLDLVFIALVSQAGGLMLGIAVALGLFRLATRRRVDDPFRKLFRWSLGCVGAFALFVTVLVFIGSRAFSDDESGVTSTLNLQTGDDGTASASLDVGSLLSGVGELAQLRSADSEDEALELAAALGRRLEAGGMSRRDIRDVLADAVPDEGFAESIPDRVVELLADEDAAGDGADEPAPVEATAAALVAGMSTEEALNRYAELLAVGDRPLTGAEADAVRARLLSDLAADSFAGLQEQIDELEEDVERQRALAERLEEHLEEAEEVGGIEGFVRFIADDLGLAFGWGTVYLSVFLAWWNGQTPGKRLVGIRVQRLDGGPITGWVSFERAGGYAAGFATGMLGFAQVYWDPNRQGIHDKIVGTVVVLDGQPPVPGPWLQQPAES